MISKLGQKNTRKVQNIIENIKKNHLETRKSY